MSPVTIRQVAKRLKLSITTVSRALDGYDDVAAKTRQRVIRTAREMGYVPSRAARQLRRQRADAIGYILPASGPHFTDPFFSEFIAGLGDEATSHKFDLLVSTAAPDTAAEREIYTRWVQSRLVDGIVVSRMRLRDWRAKYLAKNDFPFVAHGHTLLSLKFPYIEIDSRSGFETLVKHLVNKGYRRIGYIGAPARFTLQADRLAGYQNGLVAAGIPFDPALVAEGNLTRTGGYHAATQLLALPQPPTALIGANDLTAVGALSAARERGLIVGRDIAIAGYDGTEDSEHTQPPLTTLKQPVYDIACRLVKMLVARIEGKELLDPRVVLQPELIIRESTGG
ncbi:MAG: LacI family DNA-binding transcriptional regulator [Chloroflexi bacterium]|nr:LacI family DNA-binding transcriptional regulator [Chloroflexota bacterium]